MLLVFGAIACDENVPALLLLGGLLFVVCGLTGKYIVGGNLYIAILASFLIPGLGSAYLGSPTKGLLLYVMQLVSVLVAIVLKKTANIGERWLGLIIVGTFFGQLYLTAVVKRNKEG